MSAIAPSTGEKHVVRRIVSYLLVVLVALIASEGPAFAQVLDGPLGDVARITDGVRSRHASSADPTGGNGDAISIAKGETRTIFAVKGAGIITRFWVTMAPGVAELSRNDVILRIYWDGQASPSVNAPIGPFFGQGWNEAYPFVSAPLVAAPLVAAPGGGGLAMTSYFAMPFARGARIEIENRSGTDIGSFYFNIDYQQVASLPRDAGRFHAWYNRQVTPANPAGQSGSNLTGRDNYLVADIKGHGQFVGLNYFVQSPTPVWYGEGDEMVFIDGETRPSIAGTGTEDYFNMAWSPDEVFMSPYFGTARAEKTIGWLGRFHNYRFHIVDPIHFDRSLRFTIEHGHNNGLTLDLATVAYWYQSEAVGVPAIPDDAHRRVLPPIGVDDVEAWRSAWRKSMGSDPHLWGNEPAH